MNDTCCGLHCATCSWKESHGCGGCIATKGNPFHGQCPIAQCCLGKGHAHCGECEAIPCTKLFTYSYLDPVHGDKPQGLRVQVLRNWAAESGNNRWEKVLLTSAGWSGLDGRIHHNIRQRFIDMLGKSAAEAKVLFISTAAISEEAVRMVGKCRQELLDAGIFPGNITDFNIGEPLTTAEALKYDCIYFTGGDTGHLLRRIKETGFERVIKAMVHANRLYVGVSAGSLIATPNIGEPFDERTSSLALIQAYLTVHAPKEAAGRTDLPLPHIPLNDEQALVVKWNRYEMLA